MSTFLNARQIWSHTRGFSRFKLIMAQASATRPSLKPFCLGFLRLVSRDGLFWATYETGYGRLKSSFRLSQLEFDLQSFKEVGIGDCYHLPADFTPELILDGGGNTGLFTAYALKRWPSARSIIFEPVPENLERIQAHLKANGLQAEIQPVCLGSSEGTTQFYCRAANQGSFTDDLPYTHTIDVKVASLGAYLPSEPGTSCLIKLDIEGAELEVVPDIVRQLSPHNLVVGELHRRKTEQEPFQENITAAGRQVEFFDEGTCAMFHITTPTAVVPI